MRAMAAPSFPPPSPRARARRLRALGPATVLAILTGAAGAAAVHAAGSTGAATAVTAAAPAPLITVHQDSVPAHPATPVRAVATPIPAADAPGTGLPHALPAYVLPEHAAQDCESASIPHPTGFTQMGGQGTDTVTTGGSNAVYTVYARHAGTQFVCTQITSAGGVEVDVYLQPVGADESTYVFDFDPAGVTLVSVTPGRAGFGILPVPVGQRIAAWPTSGCGSASVPGNDDTFCFGAGGTLRHAVLHEHGASAQGTTRDLEATLDAFPQG